MYNDTEFYAVGPNPRVVSKEKKIKRQNDLSRKCVETSTCKVSDETCPLTGTSSPSSGVLSTSLMSLTSSTEMTSSLSATGEVVMLSPPARTSNRGMTWVSIQHSRTDRGVKVMVNLQTAELARTGAIIALTAELKRSDRLRELKPYAADSHEFAQVYQLARNSLQAMRPRDRACYVLGRLHDRGQRAAWYPDAMMLGTLNESGVLQQVLLTIAGEEYEIALDQEMSPRQQQIYHGTGNWGALQRSRPAPSLNQAPTRRI